MTKRLAAVFVLLGMSAASAAPPHDLFGYYPGQTLDAALAVDKTRVADRCDFKGVWKCIAFTRDYLSHSAKVYVQLDERKVVTKVVFNIMHTSGSEFDCTQMDSAIVDTAVRTYGKSDESEPGAAYTWRDGAFAYKLVTLCIPSVSHPPTGGVIGTFVRVSAAP